MSEGVVREVEGAGEEERTGVEGVWMKAELEGGELGRVGGGGRLSARSRGRTGAAAMSIVVSGGEM